MYCGMSDFMSASLNFQGWGFVKGWFEDNDSHILVEPFEDHVACCDCCGSVLSKRKGYLPGRVVRHLSHYHRKCFIHFQQRRFWCDKCQRVVSEHIAWVAPFHRHSVMFEQLCASLCDKHPVTDVASQMQIDKMTLYKIDENWIDWRVSSHPIPLGSVDYIGIDELMIGRQEVRRRIQVKIPAKKRSGGKPRMKTKWVWVVRPQFATIIYDLDSGRILAIEEGRDYKVAAKLLRSLGKEFLSGVKAVCMDMAACYKKAVLKVLRKVAIVFDRFHVKKYVNEAVDDVRKAAQATADTTDRQFIFNQRWLLLRTDLKERDQWRLETLFALNEDLATAYQLKDQFDAIFSLASREAAEMALKAYISVCRRSRLAPFRKLAKRLAKWKDGILNYFDHPITNGMVEGMNNVVKRVLYRGFGYRNKRYFFGKARVATGDIPTMVEIGVSVAENSLAMAG